jgi:hypothetical protein
MNYIKDQDHHWVFHVAFHCLNTSLTMPRCILYLSVVYVLLYFKLPNSQYSRTKIAKFGCLVIWNHGPSRILGSSTCWGVQFHLSNLEFKTSTKSLPPWTKSAIFRCLVIWNRGPGGTMRSPTRWGPIPPSKPPIQNTHEKIWFLEPKWLNLDVW